MTEGETISLNISFYENILIVSLQCHIEKVENNGSFFKSNKNTINDSSQIFSTLNTKLLNMIKGELITKYDDGDYSLQVKVPAKIIKPY